MIMKYFYKEFVVGKRVSEVFWQVMNFMREIEWFGKVWNWVLFVFIGDYVILDLL